MNAVETALSGARGLVRTAYAVDQLLERIGRELRTSLLPQRSQLTDAIAFEKPIRQQIESYIYDEILPLDNAESAVTNFAAVALDMAQLEDSLVDLRRAISWSSRFSGFNWWIRQRQSELAIEKYIVIPGPGRARDFYIERESSIGRSFNLLDNVITLPAETIAAIESIRLLTVPQLDGASSKWHPITLGHELAHLKFDTAWLEKCLVDLKATTSASREAKRFAQLGYDNGSADHPALLTWYVQLRSWLIEIACDSAMHHYYGEAGLVALTNYLTVHSDTGDGTEHPSPALRLDVQRSKAKTDLAVHKEPPGTSPAARERKNAFLHFALPVRDRVLRDANSQGTLKPDISATLCESATKALLAGLPPNSLDWPADTLRQSPSTIEAGLVSSLWSHSLYSATEIGPRERASLEVKHERKVDFAVDFLQFAHRFEEASANKGINHKGVLPNVLHLTTSGVSSSDSGGPGRSSVDLRLGRHFIVFKRNEIATLSALDAVVDSTQIQESVEIGWGNGFVLHPGEMVLAVTLESVVLDQDCNAQVLSRSSLGRMGLLSATAVHIQPGFRGTLTLELVNLASVPLRLSPGQRIAQIVPSAICGTPEAYLGKYLDQDWRPQFSAVAGDWELHVLRDLKDSGG